MSKDIEITNHVAQLAFHRQSLKGAVMDYIIHFDNEEVDIETIEKKTFDLFEKLCEIYKTKSMKGRLIAQVEYIRINSLNESIAKEEYHFASYSAEYIFDPISFYSRHMQKIASRMDSFHENGSSLLLNRIKHIHIALSFT